MNYYLLALKKYAEFSGRSRRAEYWFFVLIHTVIMVSLSVVGLLIGDKMSILGLIYLLAVLVPTLALNVRRLHDIGKSGWMMLIVLIPLIGVIWFIVLMLTDSNTGDNKYGPNPKGAQKA